MNILIVDDNVPFVQECSERLFAQSWDVTAAYSAERAQTILLVRKFDVALVDLMLPPTYGREGLELLRILRKQHGDSKVLMMTQKDRGTTELAADAIRLGAHYFLDKSSPVFSDKLIAMINDATSQCRKRIFVSHGRNRTLRLELKDFLLSRVMLEAVVLQDLPSAGLTVVEKLEHAAQKCFFAIILMSRDDLQADGNLRARQNVIHELGFFQGKYGRENVVLLVERGVELFTNISGIIRIEFDADHFETVFESIRKEIEVALARLFPAHTS
jgi:DNA-binding response OmpR family regulator